MGIRGLTTFISNNPRTYLSDHRLHDCIIVIDGNNISSQLYVWYSKSNSAFGGDYDRYYKCVYNFFTLLKTCNVTPLVVFDGGYETRKLGTVWIRLRNKFLICKKINPKNQTRKNMFPLLMKEHFRDILIELGVSFAQCDLEADEEIAALARELKCPVLSYDSDFLIHDVLYIPFNSVQMSASKAKDPKSGQAYYYIGCDIYKVDRFLNSFGGLQKNMLPLIATVLGNDYIKASLFDGFFSQIHLPKRNRELTHQHRKITGLLQWLRKETIISAIPKILSHVKQNDRIFVENQIQRAIASYSRNSSHLKKYLKIPTLLEIEIKKSATKEILPLSENSEDLDITQSIEEQADAVDVEDAADIDDGDISDADEVSENESAMEIGNLEDLKIEEVDDEIPRDIPAWFLQLFREGLLPSCLMDLLTKNRFYILQPQKEDYSIQQSSHDLSLPLLRYVATLLLGAENAAEVRVITRRHCSPYHVKLFSDTIKPQADLPSLATLPQLSKNERLSLLIKATGVTHSLASIPEPWHLYFLAIAYWASHAKHPPVTDKHVHAVILTTILLCLVQQSRKGKKDLAEKYSKSCQAPQNGVPDVKAALQNIKPAEYGELYSTIYVPHSHAEGRNQKITYDLSAVHSFAQFQSVLLILSQLNQILRSPLRNVPFHEFLSGTLLYNIMRALQPRQDVEAYLNSCLSKSPSVLYLHQSLSTTVLQYLAPSTIRTLSINRNPRSRKKRNKDEVSDSSSKDEEGNKRNKEKEFTDSDSEFVDSNNRFTLLLTL